MILELALFGGSAAFGFFGWIAQRREMVAKAASAAKPTPPNGEQVPPAEHSRELHTLVQILEELVDLDLERMTGVDVVRYISERLLLQTPAPP